MPFRMWKHRCQKDGETSWQGESWYCSKCGTISVYDGWHNSMHEAMAWYQLRYGLKPIGPHRHLADKVMSGAYRTCIECAGYGYHDVDHGESYRVCESCRGSGYSLVISTEELSALRAIVLAKYPHAAAPMNIGDPTAGIVLHDLAKQEMIVATDEEPEK